MKLLNLILFSLFICCFFSCAEKTNKRTPNPVNDNLITIDLDSYKKEEEINASYFFDNVRTIILETTEDVLIRDIRNIIIHNDFIVVLDNFTQSDLFIFHSDGRFSHKIGSRGMGPGEYASIFDFSLDKENNEIYVLDNSRVMKYNLLTGEFINSVQLVTNRFPSCIQYFDNDLYIDACDIINHRKELLYKIDKNDGSEIYSWLHADTYNRQWINGVLGLDGFFLSKDAINPKYANLFMDTVMSITSNGIEPYLVVNTKSWVKTEDLQEIHDKGDTFFYMKERKKAFGIYKLIEIRDALFFKLIFDDAFCYVFNSPKETRLFARMADDLVYNNGDQVPINNMVFSDQNGVYAVSYPQLLASYTGRELSDVLNENLAHREELIQLPEDSNPVIFYYEYK